MLSFIYEHYARYYEFCEERLKECQENGYLRTAIMKRIRWLGFFPEPTVVYNFSVQSMIADLMNLRLIALRPRLPKSARIVFQGHDSALVETDAGQDARLTNELIQELWDEPILVPTSGRTMVMPIDRHEGDRLSDF
jgi:DNA polymerase I-like protein with 3'-5' exonuclease and polymerase domains